MEGAVLSSVLCVISEPYLDLALLTMLIAIALKHCYSYEDWGVDELIVEDSWKRQVGGD